jgi:hypothetical protein
MENSCNEQLSGFAGVKAMAFRHGDAAIHAWARATANEKTMVQTMTRLIFMNIHSIGSGKRPSCLAAAPMKNGPWRC